MESLKDYLRVKETAEILGVSENTVRTWSRGGKLTTYRHPVNNYRLFKRDDLLTLVRKIHRTREAPRGADEDS